VPRRLLLALAFVTLVSACGHTATRVAVPAGEAPTTVEASTSTTTTTAPPHTEVVLFPFPSRLPVDHTITGGSCVRSYGDPGRPTAYHCVTGDGIFDPCFAEPTGADDGLLCIGAMTSETAARIEGASRDDDRRPALESSNPWYVDLVDGQQCGFVLGATMAIGDRRANYSCDHGWLYGDVDRSSGQWTILIQPDGATDLTPVSIVTAYY
jgi:hypothetical protein